MHRFAGRFSDLELHRTFRLLLHDDGAWRNLVAVRNIQVAKLHEIASAEFRIDGEVEQGEVSCAVPQLKPDADGPDITQLKRRLLSYELALVPRLSLLAFHRRLQSGLRWCSTVR